MASKKYLEKLRGLPDFQKKIILFAVVGILALAMLFFWVNSAAKKISDIREGKTKTGLPFLNLPSLDISSDNQNK